ncbi:Glyoxylase, beta-lactamase superfamily II [Arachidicoccus rhizosphaerae]|uniref:Glyoxylase, beta-lactamase superfamily II n=2 Tax=Arachidicoccus rhizosphaerae TaxID=551991 RepID=A0A1H4A5D0_9BACT|nr:Glyoxylase, beta-lactamase superfamily II [Arachidicoccus rhizosphaerae]
MYLPKGSHHLPKVNGSSEIPRKSSVLNCKSGPKTKQWLVLLIYFCPMRIIPLSEGAFTIDSSKKFIAFDPAKDDLQKRPVGSLLVEIQPFLIITDKDILLLDTGLGFSKDGQMQIHQILQSHGIGASEVTKVLLSHLHKDHAGGIKMTAADGRESLAFPEATYYLQAKELEYGLSGENPSYHAAQFEILKNHPKVVLLDGDGILDDYITYQVTGAHSKYHQVFWFKEAGQTIFFGADDAPQLGQMRNRFVAKYDYDGRKCMELRKQWWAEGEAGKWTFLFYHDVKSPTYTF